MVLVNFSGSAMALNWENDNLDAIVQAFYPGEKAGTAITRVLWGEANPSGRLPVTFYRNIDGFADFDDYSMTNRTYRYFEGDVLYPFGHGLSYSDFQYSSLKLPETHTNKQPLTIEVNVTNNSDIAGEEVSQVYVSMPDAPVKTPRRELKGFTRTAIEAGKSKTVAITIDADELTYVDEQGNKQPYTGTLVVSVGGGQPGSLSEEKYQQGKVNLR